jgi:hypothetical protein
MFRHHRSKLLLLQKPAMMMRRPGPDPEEARIRFTALQKQSDKVEKSITNTVATASKLLKN